MATYWLEGKDGLQLLDLEPELTQGAGADGGVVGASNPAFMNIVDDLQDSPPEATKKGTEKAAISGGKVTMQRSKWSEGLRKYSSSSKLTAASSLR